MKKSLTMVLLATSLTAPITPTLAQDKMGRADARMCVEKAGSIKALQRSQQAIRTEIDIIRAKKKQPEFKDEFASLEKQEVEKSKAFNKVVGEFNAALPEYRKNCSGKALDYDDYVPVCERNMKNPFCTAFKSYHKKLSEEGGSMPPGMPKMPQ